VFVPRVSVTPGNRGVFPYEGEGNKALRNSLPKAEEGIAAIALLLGVGIRYGASLLQNAPK